MQEGKDIQGEALELNKVGFFKTKDREKSKELNKVKQLIKFLGPAFVVSVAYVDPGNFATNISGGSYFGYELIWVILWSNIIAIFLQTMSAKLGIATGCNLPEMCARVFPRKLNWFFWIISEIGAMATDLAEFLGAALGLYLLFRIPMVYAGLLTGVITYIICYMEKYGQKTIEIIISVLVAVISVAYIIELFLAKPDWAQIGMHTAVPMLSNRDALLIAVGMLGATVMPHVIYLHSHLVLERRKNISDEEKLNHFKMEKVDINIAMNIAFIINAAMVIVSAAVFFKNGIRVDTIEQAHQSMQPLVGYLSSGVFGIALLASGLSSSAVGTIAGQTIMKGFVNMSIPINIRRLITMAPALLIIAFGINPMKVLVLSQVALSFILPFPMIQMLYIANRKDLMGNLVNRKLTKAIGAIIATMVIILNAVLIYLSFTGAA
ncbi:Nramp family divalent metal transporter [Clostridium pasteurianum]|uniref:Divalent metal cation transporter MntH n=1 Tax=Clostridium pasteurianum BC1 TaxID=86416 RepID=R4K7S5_CLOPA|nr:Nramp family divalent metal transporter [Clostridium pasteurianum]AGK95695.1 natural resistance-associated macrophage protein metal ion transporter NRAMP [Clostridium pasteurianum BC1]